MRQTRVFHLAAIPAVLLALASSSADAGNPAIERLFAFALDSDTNSCPNGNNPNSLLQSADGNPYGTTEFGATGNAATGTVFNLDGSTIGPDSAKTVLFCLTPAGEFDALHTFIYQQTPNGPLTEAANGKVYGATDINQDYSAPGMFESNPSDDKFTQHTVEYTNYLTSASDANRSGSDLGVGGSDYPMLGRPPMMTIAAARNYQNERTADSTGSRTITSGSTRIAPAATD